MTDTVATGVVLTDAAREKVRALISQEPEDVREELRLRVGVETGGCSGFIYQLYFDEQLSDDDIVSDFNGVQVVTDPKSALWLAGASIDFEDTIAKQGFTIDNPNATGSCACGDSFN